MSDYQRKSEVRILTAVDPQFGQRCPLCSHPDVADVYVVMCQECKHWIHFSCAKVDMSVSGRNFVCALCVLDETQSISISSTTSSSRARAALQLRRLDEEREMMERLLMERQEVDKRLQSKAIQDEREREYQMLQEKARLASEFLDKKYEVLQQETGSCSGKSIRSGRTNKSNRSGRSHPSAVGEWLENQYLEEGAVGGNLETSATSNLGAVPKLLNLNSTIRNLDTSVADIVPRNPALEFPPSSTANVSKVDNGAISKQLQANKQQIERQLEEFMALLDRYPKQASKVSASLSIAPTVPVVTTAAEPAPAPTSAVTAAASLYQPPTTFQFKPAPAPTPAVTAAASMCQPPTTFHFEPAPAPTSAVTAAASLYQPPTTFQFKPAPAPTPAITAAASMCQPSTTFHFEPAPAPTSAVTAAASLYQPPTTFQFKPAPAPTPAVTVTASMCQPPTNVRFEPAHAPTSAVTAAASLYQLPTTFQLKPAPAPTPAVTAAASMCQPLTTFHFEPAPAPTSAITAAASLYEIPTTFQFKPAPAPTPAVTAAASMCQPPTTVRFEPAHAPTSAVTAAASLYEIPTTFQFKPAPAPTPAVTAAALLFQPPPTFQFKPLSDPVSFATPYPTQPWSDRPSVPCVTDVSSSSGPITTPAIGQGSAYGMHGSLYGPNSQQLAARHIVPKDLPKFNGDPLDWPLFYSSYCNSTQMCGFSDAENLMRLERCLVGRARETVQSSLLHPSLVPQVLAKLYTLFGRPELIVNCLLDKVRATPAPKAEHLESLIGFGLAVQNLCAQLTSLGLETHLCNPTLLMELEGKLPAGVKLDWALHQRHLTAVDLRTFGNYMSTIVVAASKVVPYGDPNQKLKSKDKTYINTHTRDENFEHPPQKEGEVGSNSAVQPKSCLMCKKVGHRLRDCRKFSRLNLAERWKQVQESHLCHRCLSGHGKWPCKATVCGLDGCEERHHKLLHPGKPKPLGSTVENSTNPATLAVHRSGRSTLFRVLPIMLHGPKTSVEALAFLDDGSGLTLIEAGLAKQLGVTGECNPLCLQWTSNVTRSEADSQRVNLEISSASGKKFKLEDAQTVSSLDLPRQSLDFNAMAKKFPHLQNLPVKSYQNELPRVLIGLDNTHLLTTLKRREGQPQEPVATKTRLGWTIYGTVDGWHEAQPHRLLHICTDQTDQDLHDAVNDFFSLENVGVAAVSNLESTEDRRARAIMQATTKRTASGRFETGLLWRFDEFEFPDSRPMAERRLRCLERRLMTKPELYANVKQQIVDYQAKGYAHKATEDELRSADPKRVWYLPLGVVLNPNKPGKVRLIWDAAAKVRGVSLNSMLVKGPDLLIPLFAALFRFRQFQFAVTADIKEMFHQMLIRPQDRSAQRFLFRDDPTKPMETYVMDVATFGATCSPSSVQNVKNINAEEWSQEYPEAAEAITDGHYMDDYLDSLHTEDATVKLALQVKELHAKAGFDLRNWLSNSVGVLRRVGELGAQMPKNFSDDKVNGSERVLGMIWVPREDVFTFKGKFRGPLLNLISGQVIPTKREALRLVMSIFDPHGLVANVVVHGKILLQDVWRAKIGWDEQISADLLDKWQRWVKEVRNLDKVKIPRCYFSGYSVKSLKTLEMHTFVDASEEACACTVYFRIVDRGHVRCMLVAAKTKVAPLKAVTVPRLEIQSGVLGTRLMRAVEEHHSMKINRRFIHTDSSTALSWIQSDQRRYSRFVAFRVSEILDDSEISEWRWVPSRMNVADDATKWGTGPNLNSNSRWFRGPAFLYETEADWPSIPLPPPNIQEEQRASFLYHRVSLGPTIEFERFSDWRKLLKAMAYVLRFVKMCRTKQDGVDRNIVSREELQQAEIFTLKAVQLEVYPDEVVTLQRKDRNLEVEKSSSIWKLTPFSDEVGLLRMDGRVGASTVPYDAKYPVILPKLHYVTELILKRYHERFGHGNGETVINEVRQKFCVPNLRSMVSKVAKKCQWCKVYKASPSTPRMAPLPEARLVPYVRPFTFVGVDLCGPFLIRHGRSLVKRWVMLFTCLSVRAVHLEIVYTLSTESCKLGFRRFIAVRGSPQEIFSDRGTNFQGLSNELKVEISKIDRELETTFTNTYTKWNFNPPAAPHMGGVWERMVRSIKTALSTLSNSRHPDGETFETFLAEAMAIVNSRPLTHVPLQAVDEEALTPNHFLMLSSTGVTQPTQQPTDLQASLKSNWNHLQLMLDHYWARWIKEYLPTINQRRRWFAESKPISVGDLVMIVNDGIRNSWTRGRVVEVTPGKHGRVRCARVQTSSGVLTRPVVRLALLEVQQKGITGPGDQQYGSGIVAEVDDQTNKPPGDLDNSSISPLAADMSTE